MSFPERTPTPASTGGLLFFNTSFSFSSSSTNRQAFFFFLSLVLCSSTTLWFGAAPITLRDQGQGVNYSCAWPTCRFATRKTILSRSSKSGSPAYNWDAKHRVSARREIQKIFGETSKWILHNRLHALGCMQVWEKIRAVCACKMCSGLWSSPNNWIPVFLAINIKWD